MYELIAAALGGGTLATIGGGIAFVWNKIDARFTAIEAKLKQCERRDRRSRKQNGLLMSAVEILLAKIQDLAPDAAVITRARELLEQHRQIEAQGDELAVHAEREGAD